MLNFYPFPERVESNSYLPDLTKEIEQAKERLNKQGRNHLRSSSKDKDVSKYKDVVSLAQIKPILQAPDFRRKLILKV